MAKRKTKEELDTLKRLATAIDQISSQRDWHCRAGRMTVAVGAPYLPLECRLWLPKRNVAAPGHERCGFSNVTVTND